MIKYMVEYTDSVRGSVAGRDDGHPVPSSTITTNKIAAFKVFKKRLEEKGKRYGWKPPKIYEMEVTELDGDDCIRQLEEFEKTKNQGEGI